MVEWARKDVIFLNEKETPLASEMYEDLKRANRFKEKLIYILLAVIGVLIVALAATNAYHIYQWSQFDAVVVDSGDGAGNANYVQGDNTGGIFNGEGDRSQEEGRQVQGDNGQS